MQWIRFVNNFLDISTSLPLKDLPLALINSLIIITTLINKIPPNLPFKGRSYPSLASGP